MIIQRGNLPHSIGYTLLVSANFPPDNRGARQCVVAFHGILHGFSNVAR